MSGFNMPPGVSPGDIPGNEAPARLFPYYFTFGQKYRDEPHPLGISPDGWVTIMAPDENAARAKMVELCGNRWATSYDTEPELDYYHLGELMKFSTEEA